MKKLLFLFDIDGTLLSPASLSRKLLNEAITEITGFLPDLQYKDVAGCTDPSIVEKALGKAGISPTETSELLSRILDYYSEKTEEVFPVSEKPFVYEDAVVFLDKVVASGSAVGLMTGNINRVAKVKLHRFNLWSTFPFGVFGDDVAEKSIMPRIAQERAWDFYRQAFRLEHMIIVGDTSSDAYAASENGSRSIIVCRKPEHRDEIISAEPGQIVDTLDDEILLSILD
ncbi:MAG TPA: HAD family hydrolase [Candidatus Marinimicrobia bacterium]|nr:HAD family hydrolase [Candidatus Neomarinimicrobiota bacterium]